MATLDLVLKLVEGFLTLMEYFAIPLYLPILCHSLSVFPKFSSHSFSFLSLSFSKVPSHGYSLSSPSVSFSVLVTFGHFISAHFSVFFPDSLNKAVISDAGSPSAFPALRPSLH